MTKNTSRWTLAELTCDELVDAFENVPIVPGGGFLSLHSFADEHGIDVDVHPILGWGAKGAIIYFEGSMELDTESDMIFHPDVTPIEEAIESVKKEVRYMQRFEKQFSGASDEAQQEVQTPAIAVRD